MDISPINARASLTNIKNQFFLRGMLVDDLLPLPLPGSEERLIEVAKVALADADDDWTPSLEMGEWHTCDSVHCIAGWAICLEGEHGRQLEAKYGPACAGYLLLGYEAATHFFDDNERGRAYLEHILEQAEREEASRKAVEREQQDDFERQALTAAERNPSLCR
jgi:hypothetical protein